MRTPLESRGGSSTGEWKRETAVPGKWGNPMGEETGTSVL